MKRILLVGNNGQVGRELEETLSSLGEVIGTNRQTLDLTQPTIISQFIEDVQPDIIVNAAAYTAVDKAETEPELAYAINATAPKMMAEAAQKLGSLLLHISTDYVFDGKKNTPYTEEDITNPLGIYGRSKLAGEENIRQICDRHVILRTAWVYGTYGKSNFVKTMLYLGGERETIRVVCDQVGSPTWARDIADAIAQLLAADVTGTYHFTDSGVASWYDFAIAIFEAAKQMEFPLKVQQILPITTSEYPTPAQRPAYSVLATKKISNVLNYQVPYWRDSLKKMMAQLQ
jgi:dTDP-4-dehydrorhamnose reductase